MNRFHHHNDPRHRAPPFRPHTRPRTQFTPQASSHRHTPQAGTKGPWASYPHAGCDAQVLGYSRPDRSMDLSTYAKKVTVSVLYWYEKLSGLTNRKSLEQAPKGANFLGHAGASLEVSSTSPLCIDVPPLLFYLRFSWYSPCVRVQHCLISPFCSFTLPTFVFCI